MPQVTKTLWVTTISPEVVSGRQYVPTAIHYGDRVTVGADAFNAPDTAIINRGFKVDIGDISPGQSPTTRKLSECDDGTPRSSFQITKDYVDTLFHQIRHRLPLPDPTTGKVPTRLLVAEPLSFQVKGRHQDWLANYRGNLRRVLSAFDSIEFLPEPFAVYQYYRYGLNLPGLADRVKHIALIVDFGGGTLDVSIIETTHDGDVSLTGKHAKPLAASSTPFAGLYINRQIAEYLVKRALPDHRKSEAERCIRNFDQWANGQHAKEDFREASQRFIENFMVLERNCESHKIELCNSIADWRLNAEAYQTVRVAVPRDPFSADGLIEVDFIAHQLRSIFVDHVWNKRLKPAVRQVLQRAGGELRGRAIDVTLISGGSANIGWLRSLLVRDFQEELADAIPVGIQHSFQDVVANGLAIECARRHYANSEVEDSEFVAVTYNPIRLLLGANGNPPAPFNFRSVDDDIDMRESATGDLVPAAQSLRHFFEKRLRWRVKLPSRPSRSLDYLFYRPVEQGLVARRGEPSAMASSTDQAVEDRNGTAFNVEQTTVYPAKGLGYDNRITVEMTVRDDGTAAPRFVFQVGDPERGVEEHASECRPFFIDMTTSVGSPNLASYVGFDFGSSNSAICCLSNDRIESTQAKGSSIAWRGMSETLGLLPFPASFAVQNYLSCQDSATVVDAALCAYEACLGMLAFGMAAEAIQRQPTLGPSLLKGFQHRSLGPLRALLERSSRELKRTGQYFSGDLITDDVLCNVDDAVEKFNRVKHHKADASSFNWHDHLDTVVRLVVKSFEGLLFGYCATSEPERMQLSRHQGAFVVAHGSRPFVRRRRYSSPTPIDRSVALIADPERKCAISATPLFLWMDDTNAGDRSCYLIDDFDSRGKILLKPSHRRDVADAESLVPEVVPLIKQLREAGRFFLGEVDFVLAPEADDATWN